VARRGRGGPRELCLKVSRSNPAVRLYERACYEVAQQGEPGHAPAAPDRPE
jgi:hypothetical protein